VGIYPEIGGGVRLGEDTDYRTRAQEKLIANVPNEASSLHSEVNGSQQSTFFKDHMVKLTFAVAALVAVSVAGTRLQAQADQLASADQNMIVQEAQDAQGPNVEATIAPVAPIAEVQLTDVQADVPVANVPFEDVVAPALQAPVVDAPVAVEAPVAAVASGPSMDAATLSPRLAKHSEMTVNSMRRPSRGSGVGLMIFGGAALITGLIIGGDAGTVIAVGGALVGLYGLYVYLGRPTGMEHGDAARSQRIGLGYKLNTN
jgi:hypothetical protein